MNFADIALNNRTTTLVLTVLMVVGGINAFTNLSRLEDPEFTIKEAQITTPYPGASAEEVEKEVSDKIELAVQQLGQLKEVESLSKRGVSIVTVEIKDKYDKTTLPQVWDEVRRKVNDVQGQLPPRAGPSVVNDDYGDVWGVFVAVYGPEYSYAELKEYTKLLRRELSLVQDVAKVEFWGTRTEAVYIEPSRERMSQLGIHPGIIIDALRDKNIVADAGRIRVGSDYIAVQPTGVFDTVKDFESLLISGEGSEAQIYLRDVATVRRGYVEPSDTILYYDGHPAIGLGISTVSGGNVVTMGNAIDQRMQELLEQTPLGIEFGIVSLQSREVTIAIDAFLWNLIEAVAIVIAVLLVFMGLRAGFIIGFILVVTICGTFIFMGPWNVALERISLGALVIALGMLVDNAIVVVDGMLVRMAKGQSAEDSAREVVKQTAMPLLGATAVAVMAFGAIGLSQDSTGEFTRSLFQVVLLSLGLSWVTAVTVTPLVAVMFLKVPSKEEIEKAESAGQGGVYGAYSGFLKACIRFRWITIGVVLVAFGASLYGFGFVKQSFFPDSTRPQVMLDYWLPEGTYIDDSANQALEVEKYIRGVEGVTHVSTLVGAGAMRFLVTYAPEKPNSAYVQFIIDVDDYRNIGRILEDIGPHIAQTWPDALTNPKLFRLGPGDGGKIQIRFSGPDRNTLRHLADETMAILDQDGGAIGVRTDWRDRVLVESPVLAEEDADRAGITRPDVAVAIKAAFEGESFSIYREGDELLPVILRAPEEERRNIDSIHNIQIWSPAAGKMIPLRQVISDFDTIFEDPIIARLNRKTTITIHADPSRGMASELLKRIQPKVDALEKGPDYQLEWWGESRDSTDAQAGIAASVPFFFLGMVLIVITLFNALRQPLVIWLTVPLAVIGVSAGLLLTDQPFGFMALLGFMSLSGMLIKNAIVLIDEIEVEQREGKGPFEAIVDSGVSRLRPVSMAALTTALGMIPLVFDAFFVSMAVTIIFGLMVATVLTMIVVPVLYAVFFRVPYPKEARQAA